MLIKEGTVHFSSMQQIMGQRPFARCFVKPHLTSNIFINLSNAWPEMLWTHIEQNSQYCRILCQEQSKTPQFSRQSFGFIKILGLHLKGCSDWCLSSAAALTRGSITCWNKLLCNYLIISLSLLSFKKKKSTAIQLEANPVNPVLWLRIKTGRSQRSKAAVPVAIPAL